MCFSTPRWAMAEVLEVLDARYGGAENYLLRIGCHGRSRARIAACRAGRTLGGGPMPTRLTEGVVDALDVTAKAESCSQTLTGLSLSRERWTKSAT